MVAVDVLRHHRLGDRLLAADAGLAAGRELHQGHARLQPARGGGRAAPGSQGRQGRVSGRRSPRAISRRSTLIPSCCVSRWPAARRRSATIARPVTAAAPKGAFGYPNLRDDSWLWGGTLDAIHQTITHGIRANDPRHASPGTQMPAFGKSGVSTEPQIADVAEYVLSLVGPRRRQGGGRARRQDLRRHVLPVPRSGRQGQSGARRAGSDRRALALWRATRRRSRARIRGGRGGVMPAWGGRLDPETIKELAIYVHSLGGGQ